MFVMGDEIRRTQRGNNNAYCHDNELSWFDWSLVEKYAEILRFTQMLNARQSA
jgi:glycogen operon protein